MTTRSSLQDNVRYIKGVGPKRSGAFKSLGIETVKDLLDYVPFRIDDFSKVKTISRIKPGDEVTVKGRVISSAVIPGSKGPILRIGLSDDTGVCYLTWYNQPYLSRRFRHGMRIVASGRVEWRRQVYEMAHPLWETEPPDGSSKGIIIPVYHGKSDMPSSFISKTIKKILTEYIDLLPELLPRNTVDKYGFLSQKEAYRNIHDPNSFELWSKARRTFAFREVFIMQLALLLMKRENENRPTAAFSDFTLAQLFAKSLPFEFTRAQCRTINDIYSSLVSGKVMNRLIQGDVGSGKTVVAVWALLAAVSNGYQSALLAPTEVLARQHLATIKNLAGKFACIGYLTGSMKASEKADLLARLSSGEVDILIGTHAMLEPSVRWNNLGLVVTDEQHRFGVKQRLNLSYDTLAPHLLVMSATPIPRSLALTLYGDLDLSVIDELPYGRQRVLTKGLEHHRRASAYAKIRHEVQAGHQAYVVCPLIQEGASGRKAAEQVFMELKDGYLKGISLGLAHGSMNKEALAEVMEDFAKGDVKVLVATTVVEVGVDNRNATCMVVEGAESFGLATLHQLRGRVGRKGQQSYCFLIPSEGVESIERIRTLERIHDGFELAQADLELRGPGQFFGLRQHGMGELNAVDLGITASDIYDAREEAGLAVKALENDKDVPSGLEPVLQLIRERFGSLIRHAKSR